MTFFLGTRSVAKTERILWNSVLAANGAKGTGSLVGAAEDLPRDLRRALAARSESRTPRKRDRPEIWEGRSWKRGKTSQCYLKSGHGTPVYASSSSHLSLNGSLYWQHSLFSGPRSRIFSPMSCICRWCFTYKTPLRKTRGNLS